MKFFESLDESITINKDGVDVKFFSSKVKMKDKKILCLDNYKNTWQFRYPDRGSKDYRLTPYNPNTKIKHWAIVGNKTIKEIILNKEQIKFFKENAK